MASECPLCPEDEVCPGKHCLVEVEDVVAFVRTIPMADADFIAESILAKFDWPPAATQRDSASAATNEKGKAT
jgi:hypothetical protein